jgi:hypothetical protein
LGLIQNFLTELQRKALWSQEVNLDTSSRFDFDLQTGQIEQAGSGRRIDQNIKIAIIPVVAMQDGAEDARVRHARLEYKLADRLSMLR